MTSRINADTARLFNQYKSTVIKIQKTVEQLSTGRRIVDAGDGVSSFERSEKLSIDRASGLVKMQAIQSRLSWYGSSNTYLTEIRESVTKMSELSMHALSGATSVEDLNILDGEFQSLKARIAQVVDGEGGERLPHGTFGDVPFFLGFSPGVVLNTLQEGDGLTDKAVNMYTGFNHEGFPTLPFLTSSDLDTTGIPKTTPKYTGTASAGSTTTITLPETASSIDDVYQNLVISITGGAGSGQTATIASYDGVTRVATLTAAVGTALDNTSQFSIDSNLPNYTLMDIGGLKSVRFASHVWGADNNRMDHLDSSTPTFKAQTAIEREFRTANGIADTDLDPRTHEEKIARRKLNIFDPEFGNVKSKENAKRMFEQLGNAIDQISIFITREDSKAESLNQQYDFFVEIRGRQDVAIQNFSGVDFPKAAATMEQLKVAHGMIFELASRLSENAGLINDLVSNKGKR
ncbi:MAG: flagellin-like hook-associated protein FlgL [Chlamydiales bacterium]|jgi:flagellin-like hook-associated protein FlgL